ncbi:hypothetical protein [Cystobacter fuscus]|uniref:hypothetical protein n=1 Tax=Cystobacter fuscus TaxID=43 RepID=UPI002B2E8E6D|nr:hypothetical protein F0U63_35920 [Cystobacter fuscus]
MHTKFLSVTVVLALLVASIVSTGCGSNSAAGGDAGSGNGGNLDGGSNGGADNGSNPRDGGVNCPALSGTVNGFATLAGDSDPSGILVSISQLDAGSYTGADGFYSFNCVPVGQYSMQFRKSGYEDGIAAIQTYAGGNAQILDHAYYPLSPIELSRGTRLRSFQNSGFWPGAAYSLSPNAGSVLSYSADNGGALFLATLDGQKSRTLDTGSISSNFAYSPDGQWLYWLNGSTLKMGAADGTDVTILMSNVSAMPTFAPDGKSLAFGSGTNAYLAPVGSTTVRDLGPRSTSCESSFSPLFAADGTLVWKAFTSSNYCLPISLHLTPSDGGPDIVFPTVGRYELSPDRQFLAFNDGYCAGPSYGCGPAEAGIERVTKVGVSGPVMVGPGAAGDFSGGAEVFSPDNSHILYATTGMYSYSYPLVIAQTNGGGSRQLTSNINGCSLFGFSPDSGLALYAVPGTVTCDLIAAPVDGGPVRVIGANVNTNSLGGSCGGLCPGAWLFTGNSIIFVDGLTSFNGTGQLKVVALGTGVSTHIASDVGRPVFLSADGQQVLFGIGSYPHAGLYLSSVENPAPVLVGNTGRFGALSPDGKRALLYTDCPGTCILKVLTLSTAKTITLASGVSSAAWAPDGHAVAFVTDALDQVGTLRFASADGGSSTVVAGRAMLLEWTSPNSFLGRRVGVPAPYSFQNGLYLFPAP